ncbi:MAG: hypothetical protein ACOC31_01815 [Bacteroidota bacterium]
MKIKTFILIIITLLPTAAWSQRLVSFYTSDSVEVFADVYLKNPSYPYIIMAHAPGSSRGEFNAIAEKLLNLDYNCLVLDMRHGDKINYVQNLTVQNNSDVNLTGNFEGLSYDIEAAIDYVYGRTNQPVILAGSLVSGSVAMILARNNARVKAVLAFSPGEYLRPDMVVSQHITAYNKPLCVLAGKDEKPFIQTMLEPVAPMLLTTVYHQADRGYRGARLLWETNSSSDKFWFDLLLFFNQLKKN